MKYILEPIFEYIIFRFLIVFLFLGCIWIIICLIISIWEFRIAYFDFYTDIGYSWHTEWNIIYKTPLDALLNKNRYNDRTL